MAPQSLLPRLLLGAASTASTASVASGAIVVFDINPDITHSDSVLNAGIGVASFDLSNGTYVRETYGSFSGYGYGAFFNVAVHNLRLKFGPGGGGNTQTAVYLNQFNDRYISWVQAGDTIDGNLSTFDPEGEIAVSSTADGAVPQGAGTLYIPLIHYLADSTYYGWFEVEYSETQGGNRDYTFTRFAFNDVDGQSILAGQTTAVPEASTLGFAGGLFGLVALAHARRRKAKQAAASDKFLSLAAGEKLN